MDNQSPTTWYIAFHKTDHFFHFSYEFTFDKDWILVEKLTGTVADARIRTAQIEAQFKKTGSL